MSKTNVWENELLLHLFNNADVALVGDAAGLQNSAVAGSLYMSLHTADPGEAGDQSTSEVTYTSYARVAIARAAGAGGFNVTGNAVATASNTNFPAGTGGGGTATHWGIGCSSAGAGKLLYKGALSAGIICGSGVTPIVNAGTAVTED